MRQKNNLFTYFRKYDGDVYGVTPKLFNSPSFWLVTLLVVVICLIPICLIIVYETVRPEKLRIKLKCKYLSEIKSNYSYEPIMDSTTTLLIKVNWV